MSPTKVLRLARKNKIALVLAVAALPFILLNVWLARVALGGFVVGAVVVFLYISDL